MISLKQHKNGIIDIHLFFIVIHFTNNRGWRMAEWIDGLPFKQEDSRSSAHAQKLGMVFTTNSVLGAQGRGIPGACYFLVLLVIL